MIEIDKALIAAAQIASEQMKTHECALARTCSGAKSADRFRTGNQTNHRPIRSRSGLRPVCHGA
jgi:hypothetical protein